MLGSRAFPCHKTSRTRLMSKEGVQPRVCPVCKGEWVVVVMPMITAKGLKIGWIRREDYWRILRAVHNEVEMEVLEGMFGRLLAELSDEIARIGKVVESEEMEDAEEWGMIVRRPRRPRTIS